MQVKLAEILRGSVDFSASSDSLSVQTEHLKHMKEQTEIARLAQLAAEKERRDKLEETRRDEDAKKNVATARAKAKCEAVIADASEMKEELKEIDPSDYENESDLSIERACMKIKTWRKKLEKITSLFRETKDIVAGNDVSEDDVDLVDAEYLLEEITEGFKVAYKILIEEDNKRELYTFDSSKTTDLVKLPTFEGRDDEDFADFRDKVKQAFVRNRVIKDDKLDKLRSCLRGRAKKLVPDNLTGDIDQAWEALNIAFGDPDRLMNFKRNALRKLGELPKKNAKIKVVIDWYLSVESLLKGILDLGRKDSKLGSEVFNNGAFLQEICGMFPQKLGLKLGKVPGELDKKLEAMIAKISEWRKDAQNWQIVTDSVRSSRGGSNDNTGAGPGGGGSGKAPANFGSGRGSVKMKPGFEMPNLLVYNPPRRDVNCRVCKTLESIGDTVQLYDNHVNSYPTGCPRYIGFSIEERNNIARRARLCLRCHDPNYVFKHNDPTHKCIVGRNKKSKYTCSNNECTFHMWVCNDHKAENNAFLEKFKQDISVQFKLSFGYIVSVPFLETITFDTNINAKGSNIKKVMKKKKKTGNNETDQPALENEAINSGNDLSSDEAIDKLKEKLNFMS